VFSRRQVHSKKQSLEARAATVAVVKRIVVSLDKPRIALLVGRVERFKHRIRFPHSGVIGRGPDSAAVRAGELRRQFPATLAVASLMIGRG